jgi:TatD DNase family protein
VIEFVDTHAHVHFDDYGLDADETLDSAHAKGVTRVIEVGCTLHDSKNGVKMAERRDGVWASVGIHPHEARDFLALTNGKQEFSELLHDAKRKKIVAIGETGLDFYYNHSPKAQQIELLKFQLELAGKHDLPLIFHVRDAFDEFWPVFDRFPGLRGVVHSFTATKAELDKALARGLYIGLNGIMTFTKVPAQLEMAQAVPADRLVLETDAPYLTPKPFRGTICMPEHVIVTAKFLADLRGETLENFATQTTQNAIKLFNLLD